MIDLGIAVSNLTATLKTLDSQEHLKNPYIIQELEDKLSYSYRVKWLTWVKEDKERADNNLTFFFKWIVEETDMIRRARK